MRNIARCPCLDEVGPVERRADLVVQLHDGKRPVLTIAFEAQRRIDATKHLAWLRYAVALRPPCEVCILVITDKRHVARWAARPYPLGPGNQDFRVWVLGPDDIPRITDLDAALRAPEEALLSGLLRPDPETLKAAAAALTRLDNERAEIYFHALHYNLRAPLRHLLQAYVMELEKLRALPCPRWLYDLKRKIASKGRRDGRQAGELDARRAVLLRLLDLVGAELTPAQQRKVDACDDLATLDAWIDRVFSTRSARGLFTRSGTKT